MIFAPDGIKKQEFNKSFRGFDREEVHAFLEKISAEFGTLFNENDELKKELVETKQQLEKYLQLENKIQHTLSNAEKKSKKMIEESEHKAGEILRLAEEKSSELLKKAHAESDELKSSMKDLREEKEILLAKLKSIINYQARLFEMKIEEDEEVIHEPKQPAPVSKIKVDVNEIVEKLL